MLAELYQQYRRTLELTPFSGEYMPYEWGGLPRSLGIEWMAYGQMFNEFSREIANSLNQMTNYTDRLRAWSILIPPMTNDEKMEATIEFIDPLATVALNLPYAIRSQFIFAAAHLCHQANRARDTTAWSDGFPPDRKIYFDVADKYGEGWLNYKLLKECLERFGDKKYQRATLDFRHAWNHRFSPGVVMGITRLITRRVDPKTNEVSYAFGGNDPLGLDAVTNVLTEQCKIGYSAFAAFRELIKEHETKIAEYEARSTKT